MDQIVPDDLLLKTCPSRFAGLGLEAQVAVDVDVVDVVIAKRPGHANASAGCPMAGTTKQSSFPLPALTKLTGKSARSSAVLS